MFEIIKNNMIILITIAAFFSTLLGGLFALHLKDRLHLILGFSAGAIVGVAFFDMLPEALELAGKIYSASTILTITVIGFASYLVLDRFVLLHDHSEDNHHSKRGNAGAGSLSFHSFLDGVGIGLAFQVSSTVGLIVAAAVLTHDFSAQEEGFKKVFLGEDSWYAIRLATHMLDKIKYIAAYQVAPISAVTYYAEVKSIVEFGEEGKYKLIFNGPAMKIEKPITFDLVQGGMQGPRYTSFEKLRVE
jgi:hypothetical protein